MAAVETMTADKLEKKMSDIVEKMMCRRPQNLTSFVEENKLVCG